MPYNYDQSSLWKLKAVFDRIEQSMYKKVSELQIKAWITEEPVPFSKKTSGTERELHIGESWGNLWDCAWFHFTGEVPTAYKGQKIVLLIDISGEACIFDEDGCPIQGLTNTNSEFDYSLGRPGKKVVPFLDCAAGGEKVEIWADAGCNDLFGKYKDNGTILEAHVAVCYPEIRALYYDIEVLSKLMMLLPKEKARYHSIFHALQQAAKVMKHFTEEEAVKARELLAPELKKEGGDSSLRISAIGHAHIDLAWLWPIRETIRKGARTFATALKMMELYPDYIFGASQPQLYDWMKIHYPALYQKVKEKVAEGRWEVQGGMWVEADTNISSGEALVRQIIYGKRFFEEEFNKEMKTLWLPDVFGYTAALPQILKKSGIDYFTTIKLSWNNYNKHPHHTFLWQGLDGSQVLVHMPPEGTYNSSASPEALSRAETNYLDKGVSEECLMLFGIGDGGGGPGMEHLERLQREKNLNGLPSVVQEHSIDFFNRLNENRDLYKTWVGELYLERHQGTYTTQSKNKKYNRKLEYALRDLELAASQALYGAGLAYPKEEIEQIWKEVLLYQFHDILPGSSIGRVYKESVERYEAMQKRVKELTHASLEAFSSKIDTKDLKKPVLLSNSLSWNRKTWVERNGSWMQVQVPCIGYSVVDENSFGNLSIDTLKAEGNCLENDEIKVLFHTDGSISEIYDKVNNRNVLAAETPANTLAVYDDYGDAWDFDIAYDELAPEKFILESSKAYAEGPQAILHQIYAYGSSTLEQKVILTAGSFRIDFKTEVHWNERNKMLRTSFPLNVYATEATCEVQFGNIKRPTHRNTTWDMAKYEISAHKWVDLSDNSYGAALLNDSKYGYKVLNNVLDLNLLRSPGYPDEAADQGVHEFTYALYPHQGNYVHGRVIQEAYELNIPVNVLPIVSSCGTLPLTTSFFTIDAENIIVESVKKAEDSDALILRLYESQGMSKKVKVHFNLPVKALELVNMLEQAITEIPISESTAEVTFGVFEIQTIKVIL